MDSPVGERSGLARSLDPRVIEPPAGRNLAAIVKPELLFQAGIHWLTLIDQRDLADDRNPRAILLPNFCEDLITQCAPHRTNVVEVGQLHTAQVSNPTNKFYKRSQRETFEQEITARHSRNHRSGVLDRRGFGKSEGCKTKPHQDHTAIQRDFIASLASTSRPF